jgi:hypothetical protein
MIGRGYLSSLTELVLIYIFLSLPVYSMNDEDFANSDYTIGVYNNFDFGKTAEVWSEAAQQMGGKGAVVDLVVAQAHGNGLSNLAFPFASKDFLYSSTRLDRVEPYLEEFDRKGLKVILSVQPMESNVTQLIDILLFRYGHHRSIIGVNIDIEWKMTGLANHVSNEERDTWLHAIKKFDPELKLYLTYFEDHTHFPEDARDLTVLYDGENASQSEILKNYRELSKHYSSVGIYTGYSSAVPPTASRERIIEAAPNTNYILYTDNVCSDKKIPLFLVSDVQVDWLESTSIDLINQHKKKYMPVNIGFIPCNLDNPDVGGGYLPKLLRNLDRNDSDLFEIVYHGYSSEAPEELIGKNYSRQKRIIEGGLKNLMAIGLKPSIFLPPLTSADETTARVAEDSGFKTLVTNSKIMNSDKLLILDYILLTETKGNRTVLKSPEKLMEEIDKSDGYAIVILYSILDFQYGSGNNVTDLGNIFDTLRASRRYQFMTIGEYQDMVVDANDLDPPKSSMSFSPIFLILLILVIRKHFK